jgi:site-specific recombinase XerD
MEKACGVKSKTSLPPEPLTKDEIILLLSQTGKGACGLRDRALIVLLWRAGLRISEALRLQLRDIDKTKDGTTVRVRHGKNDNHRTVAIGVDATAYLDAWLATRSKYPSNWVFCRIRRRNGKHDVLTPSAVRKLLKHLAQKAGIEKRVHAHGFRHTFALELDSEGVPLRVIQQALGHADASTTSTYLSALGGREVVGMLANRKI